MPAFVGERLTMRANGQDWRVTWHGPDAVPDGQSHGAAGVCLGPGGELVLISPDGERWDLPAGRREADESLEETLRRDMREEACVEVLEARLLGFSRGECVRGHEHGLVLVRSFWRADVRIDPWRPEFEIAHRRVVSAAEAVRHLGHPHDGATRILLRALVEAGVEVGGTLG